MDAPSAGKLFFFLNLLNPVSFPKGFKVGVENGFLPYNIFLTFIETVQVRAVLTSQSHLSVKDAAAAAKGNDVPVTIVRVPGSGSMIVPG